MPLPPMPPSMKKLPPMPPSMKKIPPAPPGMKKMAPAAPPPSGPSAGGGGPSPSPPTSLPGPAAAASASPSGGGMGHLSSGPHFTPPPSSPPPPPPTAHSSFSSPPGGYAMEGGEGAGGGYYGASPPFSAHPHAGPPSHPPPPPPQPAYGGYRGGGGGAPHPPPPPHGYDEGGHPTGDPYAASSSSSGPPSLPFAEPSERGGSRGGYYSRGGGGGGGMPYPARGMGMRGGRGGGGPPSFGGGGHPYAPSYYPNNGGGRGGGWGPGNEDRSGGGGGYYSGRGGGMGSGAPPPLPPLRAATNTVWVGNLDYDKHTDETLLPIFSEFGLVMRIAKHLENNYSFIHFRHVHEAENAVVALRERQTLGAARYNYGKMFDYSEEEMRDDYVLPDGKDPTEADRTREPPSGMSRGGGYDQSSSAPHHHGYAPGSGQQEAYPSPSAHWGGEQDRTHPSERYGAGGLGPSRPGDYDGVGRDRPSSSPPPPPPSSSSSSPASWNAVPQRGPKTKKEPSNVLWVGSLPEFISDDRLREIFEPFGTVKLVSRMERGNMAFVHFTTVEECQLALDTMRGKRVEGNVMLTLNFGHPQRTREEYAAQSGGNGGGETGAGPPSSPHGIPGSGHPHTGEGHHATNTSNNGVHPNEVATNVVYLGQLPPNATEEDVEAAFTPYEGYIFSKVLLVNAIAFGYFDSVQHATDARMALRNTTLCGVPIRVSYGKTHHTYSMEDKPNTGGGGGGGGGGEDLTSPYTVGGGKPYTCTGAELSTLLAASAGALVLPTMTGEGGGGAGLLANPLASSANGASGSPFSRPEEEHTINFQKERAAPELNLRARLQSVVGSTYNGCGAFDVEMAPSQVQAICMMVDQCVDEAHSDLLATTLSLYLPQHAVHVFNVITKRLQEFYAADPIRKLLVVYAVTKVLLQTSVQSYREHQQRIETRHDHGGEEAGESAPVLYTPAALNAFLMTLLAASERQSRDGADRLITIMDGLQHHSTLLAPLSEVSPGYKASFDAQLKEIRVTAEAEQDLSSILSRRKQHFS